MSKQSFPALHQENQSGNKKHVLKTNMFKLLGRSLPSNGKPNMESAEHGGKKQLPEPKAMNVFSPLMHDPSAVVRDTSADGKFGRQNQEPLPQPQIRFGLRAEMENRHLGQG